MADGWLHAGTADQHYRHRRRTLEIFAATAKAGLVALPINFRLMSKEVQYIVENAGASALIVQDELFGIVEDVRKDLPIKPDRFIHFGVRSCPAGYRSDEQFTKLGSVGCECVGAAPIKLLD